MLNPVGRAGVAVVTPLLKANDPNAGAANWTALNSTIASARRFRAALSIQLPAGVFHIGASTQSILTLDEYLAGLVVRGMGAGKTILVPASEAEVPSVSMLSTRVALYSIGNPQAGTLTILNVTDLLAAGYQVNDVIYVWQQNSGNNRSPSQRLTVFNAVDTTITVNETIGSFSSPVRMKHVKGVALSGQILANSNTVTLANSGLASRLTLGGDVLIGDGPALNNFYSEWARVAGISGTTVTLDRRLRRTYAPTGSDRGACIVPGPHMSDITIRDLTIVVPDSEVSTLPLGTIRFGLRVRFENVDFAPLVSGSILYRAFEVVNCGETSVENGTGNAQLMFAATQDSGARNSVVASIVGNEYCSDLIFDDVGTYRPEGFSFASTSGPGPCERIHLLNSRITNHGNGSSASNVNFVKDSVISNVQIVQPNHSGTPPTISLEDDRLSLTNVTSGSAISVSGDDLRIENLTSTNGLTLASGSTGVLVTPLLPTTVMVTDSSGGGWRTPLPMTIDRKVVSTGTSEPTLQVMALINQTADLQQWQNNSGTVQSRMNKDGYFITHKTSAPANTDLSAGQLAIWFDATAGSSLLRIKARDANGNLVFGSVALS